MKTDIQSVFIKGEKVFLRACEPGDMEMITGIENHPDTRETLFYALPTNAETQQEKISGLIKDHNTIILTICSIDNKQPVGQTALVRIDWIGRMATFYLALADKKNQAKGYGTETVKLMLEYSFNELNLNRVQLHVAIKNTAAVKVYEKSGFIIEGTLREAMYQHGKYWDFYLMGILKSDWLSSN